MTETAGKQIFSLLFLTVVTLFSGCTTAQKEYSPEFTISPTPPPEKMEELLVPMIEDRKGAKRLLTFSLRDADIREVLLSLSKTIDYNIVLDPDISGRATVDVRRLTPEEALDAILTPLRLQYKKENNYIRVSKYSPETRVFQLNYVNSVRTGTSSLNTFFNVSRTGGGGTGGVSTTVSTDFWGEIEKGIKELISAEGKFSLNKTSGTVIVTDIPPYLKKVASFLEHIEGSVQRQVMIQAKVMSVDLSDEFQMGLDWSAITEIAGLKGTLTGGRIFSQSLSPSTGVFQIGLSDTDFSLLMDAVARQGKVKILSSPKISTINNQKAAIKVVRNEVFFEVRTDIVPNTGITTTSTTTNVVDVGVVLEVSPQISSDGQIIMNVHSIITEKVDDATFESEDVKLTVPVITSREADTVVKIKDGHTMVIAGLIQDKADTEKRKVPFLGDIPGIGTLFNQMRKSNQKNELVIFLTPTVLTGSIIDEISQEELRHLKQEEI